MDYQARSQVGNFLNNLDTPAQSAALLGGAGAGLGALGGGAAGLLAGLLLARKGKRLEAAGQGALVGAGIGGLGGAGVGGGLGYLAGRQREQGLA